MHYLLFIFVSFNEELKQKLCIVSDLIMHAVVSQVGWEAEKEDF